MRRPAGARIGISRFESNQVCWRRKAPNGRPDESERCRSGRTGLIRNQVCAYAYRGFESHPLRQNVKGPSRGLLHFRQEGMGFRTLFDQRSRAAASWRGAREAGDSIPPPKPKY